MKKMLLTLFILIFCGSLIPSFASQRVASTSRVVSKSTISGTNIPYVQPAKYRHHNHHRGRCHNHNYYHGPGVQVYKTHHHRYVTQYYDGFENSSFSRKSYYIPTYCQPGAAMHDGMYNPFCNQYQPYGSGVYVSF